MTTDTTNTGRDKADILAALEGGDPLALLKVKSRMDDAKIARLEAERLLLAKLAADTPQFNNPLIAFEAQALRDRILKGSNG